MPNSALFLYFFPHSDNNHRAKILHPLLIIAAVFIFIFTQVFLSFSPRFIPIALGYTANISPEQVVTLTNKERERAGLAKLQIDPELTTAALSKASYMFAKNYWAHTAPDGTEPWKFVNDAGYKYRYAGENLARDFSTPEAAMTAWMNSPSHKDNILSSRYQDIGVAVVNGELNGVQTTLIVQFFGTKMVNAAQIDSGNSPQVAQGVTKVVESPNVIGVSQTSPGFVFPKFSINKNLSLVILSFFLLILAIDIIVVGRNRIVRTASKSFAHVLFLGMIVVAIIIAKAGNIL